MKRPAFRSKWYRPAWLAVSWRAIPLERVRKNDERYRRWLSIKTEQGKADADAWLASLPIASP